MKKLGLIWIALIVALSTMGVAYAKWAQALTMSGNVANGTYDVVFDSFTAPSNINGAVFSATRVDSHTCTISLSSLYPSLDAPFNFVLKDTGTIPAKITAIKINGDTANPVNIKLGADAYNDIKVTVSGISTATTINANGGTVSGSVLVHTWALASDGNDATGGASGSFTLQIDSTPEILNMKTRRFVRQMAATGTAMILATGFMGVCYAEWTQSLSVSASPVSIADPPAITTDAASNVTATSATLNGHLSALAPGGTAVTVYFNYGLTAAYGTTVAATPGSVSLTSHPGAGDFSYNLSGLVAGQTYHFQAKGVGFFTVFGANQTFLANAPLSVITNAASGLGHNGSNYYATLNGSLNSLGQSASAILSFEYGPTTSYGSTIAGTPASWSGAVPKPFTAYLSGMSNKQVVHFRAKAVGTDGTIVYGADRSFTN